MPRRLQDQPHPHIKPKYGLKVQYKEEEDSSPPLTAAKKKLSQEVLRVFLYYGRAIGSTILASLRSISTQQAAPTENIMRSIHQFWTMQPLVQMQSSPSHPATWSSQGTDTPLTYRNPRLVAGPAATSSS